MRTLLKTVLVGLVALTLVQAPVQAAPANPVASPLGVIVQANRAVVGANEAAGGATIFDGDTLITDSVGTLRASFGGSQAFLLPQTTAIMHSLAGGVSADLNAGTIVVSSPQGGTFSVLADGATVRPKNARPAIAQVTMVSPSELVLMSRAGDLEVSIDGQSHSIAEGTSYRMLVQPADPGSPQGPAGAGSNHNKVIFIIIAAAAAATAVTLFLALESPSKP